tara:strand:+ start:183 stop:416 length:234 start_codon:yes stop_codon:yes gene_type:complete
MTNQEILKTINFLLSINEDVYWSNSNYKVKKDADKKLIVVCDINDYTTPLTNCDLKKCGTHKWAIRENDLYNFKMIN